jgi:hypothetical protein
MAHQEAHRRHLEQMEARLLTVHARSVSCMLCFVSTARELEALCRLDCEVQPYVSCAKLLAEKKTHVFGSEHPGLFSGRIEQVANEGCFLQRCVSFPSCRYFEVHRQMREDVRQAPARIAARRHTEAGQREQEVLRLRRVLFGLSLVVGIAVFLLSQQALPIDCVVTEWANVGECSLTCGEGRQKQRREIAMPAKYGGAECPSDEQHVPCNADPCPVDCVMSEWSNAGGHAENARNGGELCIL